MEHAIHNTNSVRNWLKQFETLVRVKKAVRGAVYGFDSEILGRFPIFEPWSTGPSKALEDLTVLAVNQTFPLLAQFLAKIGKDQVALVTAEAFCVGDASRASAGQLRRLLDRYGSDKAEIHDYHFIYGTILNRKEPIAALLEVGLGSSNEDVVSNMGKQGKPGASLRAFRDFLPGAQIYGADVDRRILFEEERIRTFFVDQTDLGSFEALAKNVGDSFDLIIDDGLHSPNANLGVLIFAVNRLKPGGWLVVEDIPESALDLWKVVAALLPAGLRPHLIQAKNTAIVFAVEKAPLAA